MPNGPLVGRQPAICQWCREPFMAADAGTRFCSGAHRVRAWRERQRQAA
jgi:hypothetical protein